MVGGKSMGDIALWAGKGDCQVRGWAGGRGSKRRWGCRSLPSKVLNQPNRTGAAEREEVLPL